MQTVLLFYKYIGVADPAAEKESQLSRCRSLGLTGRILLGPEGINGTVAGTADNCQAYMDMMSEHPLFNSIHWKIDRTDQEVFPRLRVRVRDEIVTLGVPVDQSRTAPRLSPEAFNQIKDRSDVVLFDARNNYESAIGRFSGAITPDISLFKELPRALDNYESLKDKTVVTYCTGGIRCEKASALMLERGFKNVYQLDGGIINYAQKFPDGAFQGECFVFDGRMSVAFKPSPEQMGECFSCQRATNLYANCAYPSCNKLILVCSSCNRSQITCSLACQGSFAQSGVI